MALRKLTKLIYTCIDKDMPVDIPNGKELFVLDTEQYFSMLDGKLVIKSLPLLKLQNGVTVKMLPEELLLNL